MSNRRSLSTRRWLATSLAALGAASIFSVAVPAIAGEDVKVLVLKEEGIGSSSQAQPYIDQLVAIAARVQGWSSAKGVYHTDRASGEAFIDSDSPQYGILSLPAYLALHDSRHLEAIGSVTVAHGGGERYFIVSKSASDLSGCKGDKLATRSTDTKFIDKIVAAGDFKMSDFTVSNMKRPLQPMKAVINGEAKCALIDDAQYAELAHIDGGADLKDVWKSATLPAMPVVAFPDASGADKASFRSNLSSLCQGDGQKACDAVGIKSIASGSEADYASILAAYQ